jgi:hypothetical protein
MLYEYLSNIILSFGLYDMIIAFALKNIICVDESINENDSDFLAINMSGAPCCEVDIHMKHTTYVTSREH